MAAAYQATGQVEAAVAVLEKALPLLPADDQGRAEMLNQAAEICLKDSRLLQRAVGLFTQAGALEAAFVTPEESARRSAHVAKLLRERGAAEDALTFADRAVDLAPEGSADAYGMADALNDRALDLVELKRYDDARTDLLRCIELCETSADGRLLQMALANLAEVERQRGEAEAAVEAAQRAVALARDLAEPGALAHSIENLGLAYEDSDRLDDAQSAWMEFQQLGETQQVSEWRRRALSGRAREAFLRRDYVTAGALYQEAEAASNHCVGHHICARRAT